MSGNAKERVLVMGDDMRIFLAVVRSLGRAGKEVHAAPLNWHSPALRSRYVRAVHQLPRYSDDPAAWLAVLSRILQAQNFDLLVPCGDQAILPLHSHRNEFSGHRVAIPGPLAMELLFDKERTRELCEQLGIPVARSAPLRPGDTAAALADRFALPLVLKPRKSFSIDRLDCTDKVWIVESRTELQKRLAEMREPTRYLAQAYFEGVGVGVSVLAQSGRIRHAFQHRRLREGRGGSSSYRVSETVDSELLHACETICDYTQHTGVCMFEFRRNAKTGAWILLETNARFWGSLPLPLSLGVDFPRFLYDLLVHEVQHPTVPYAAGIRARNLVLDGFNLFSGLRHLTGREFLGWVGDVAGYLVQPLRWTTGHERSDTFVRDDLRPALWECALLCKSVSHKLTRRRAVLDSRRRSEQAA
jgi:predicted ATP-grasp superfamily ATP-dependent carboligase